MKRGSFVNPLTDEEIKELVPLMNLSEEMPVGHFPGLRIARRKDGVMWYVSVYRAVKLGRKSISFRYALESYDKCPSVEDAVNKAKLIVEKLDLSIKRTRDIKKLRSITLDGPLPEEDGKPQSTEKNLTAQEMFKKLCEEKLRKALDEKADAFVKSELEALGFKD